MERLLIVNADDFGLSKVRTTALSRPVAMGLSRRRRRGEWAGY